MPSTNTPVRMLIKLELNMAGDGVVFYNPSITLATPSGDRVLWAGPGVSYDQHFSRLQNLTNNMLQRALNELQRAVKSAALEE